MNRDFKGVWIPKAIWLDERLSMLDKGILTEIDSLDCGEEGCWASNAHLADFCQCSESKVSKSISHLIQLGYVRVESFDGRVRKLQSCIAKNARQTSRKCEADQQKMPVSNTRSNTKSKSTTRKREVCDFPPGFDDFWNAYPRKVAKQNAAKAWGKTGAADSKALADTIIADVQRRVNGEWKGKEVQYIPHPTTYLNQRRWEDETTATDTVDAEPTPTWRDLSPEEKREMEDRLADEYWASRGK